MSQLAHAFMMGSHGDVQALALDLEEVDEDIRVCPHHSKCCSMQFAR